MSHRIELSHILREDFCHQALYAIQEVIRSRTRIYIEIWVLRMLSIPFYALVIREIVIFNHVTVREFDLLCVGGYIDRPAIHFLFNVV